MKKGSRLGGNLIPGGAPDFKEDDIALADWYTNELNRLGVHVRLNTELNEEEIKAMDYDTVILATGSKPKVFSLGDDSHTYTDRTSFIETEGCWKENCRCRWWTCRL